METSATPVTQPFREEHVEIKKHLGHIGEMIGSLPAASSAGKRELMEKLVAALSAHILPHAEWEERVLYPVVDRLVGGKAPFTAAMRHEHGIVQRSISLLADQAENPTQDGVLFARTADQLLGLILAHFEDEEEVLLPILDANMTAEEFEREILSKGSPHG
jgi:hemerythrin-like domain-containing protein